MRKLNRFVFIVPMYNAERTLTQMMLSVISQSYSNWHVILIDDVSSDRTVDIAKTIVSNFGLHNLVTIIENKEKKWEVENVLAGLKLCKEDDIVCRLDGDDWLCDLDALSIINSAYNETGVDALWTAHRWAFTHQNISRDLPEDADPYKHPWVSSHLKTFRKHLITNVHDDNFRNADGEYFKRIGDQAIYLPVLKKSKKWMYLPIVAYHYTINMLPSTFQSDDAKFQKSEADYLRNRGFIDG